MAILCLFLSLVVGKAFATPRDEVIKGVSYGPVPLNSTVGASQVPADDWFCDKAVPMWGEAGRGDLRIIKQLGANMVRLYGNSADADHTNFLDEALVQGLSVAPGMTDFPYYQNGEDSCAAATDFDCFSQVKPLYVNNLQNGFLSTTNAYHPALKYFNILNEPDLKMPYNADNGGIEVVYQMCRAIISAFDALLEAEKEVGVTGPLINFTATFSFAICKSCEFSHGKPALSQIAQLDDAMRNPEKYNYSAKNDITAAYIARFTHSFNTANPAADVQNQFLDTYEELFPTMPVYIAEYHNVGANQTEDLQQILQIAEASPVFLGVSFFQYQVAYWKGGSEEAFGMFQFGDMEVASMPYISQTYPIYCLHPTPDPDTGKTLPDAVAEAYGGPGVDPTTLCVANPAGVGLDQAGYMEIAAQHSTSQMVRFVQRLLEHMGASVKTGNQVDLDSLAARHSSSGGSSTGFADIAGYIGSRPNWLEFDPKAKCVADRSVRPGVIGSAIGWVCSQPGFDCGDLPPQCNSTYRIGDYLFSRYFALHGDSSDLLSSCSFSGAALYAPSKLYDSWTGSDLCVQGTTTTPWTTSSQTTADITSAAPTDNSGTDDEGSSSTLAMDTERATTTTPLGDSTSTAFLDMPTRSGSERFAPRAYIVAVLLCFLAIRVVSF